MTISVEIKEWIKGQESITSGITEEMLIKWYGEITEELKQFGLDKTLEGGEEGEEFIEMVKTGVVGRKRTNMSVEPTDFKLMIIGPYPEKNIKNKPSVELVALASLEDGDVKLTSLTGSREFVSVKNDIEALASYETGVSYNKDAPNIDPAIYKLYVQAATKFSDATKTDFVAKTYDEKMALLRKMVPKIDLGSIEAGRSRLKKSKNDKPYADSLDLRRVVVQVQGFADAIDKTGRPWAMYHVVDGTFKPTIQMPHIAVWVDPSIYNRLQAGEGSFLEIYGLVDGNKDGTFSMSACFIHPVHIKPVENKDGQAQTDQPGGTVQTPPARPQIQVMSSISGMGM